MRDIWYADNRDLVKWGVLLELATMYGIRRVLQIAYYRPSEFGPVVIDGQEYPIRPEVLAHFRNLRNIPGLHSDVSVTVFDRPFLDREEYREAATRFISAFHGQPSIVFLDPDTGLEPQNPAPEHVLEKEAKAIWEAMKTGDMLVFYQHQTNLKGEPWIEPKRDQLARALGIPTQALKVANAPLIARDVAFFFARKA